MCVRMLIYDDTVSASSHIYVTEYTIQWTKQEAQLCNSYRLSCTVSRSVMCWNLFVQFFSKIMGCVAPGLDGVRNVWVDAVCWKAGRGLSPYLGNSQSPFALRSTQYTCLGDLPSSLALHNAYLYICSPSQPHSLSSTIWRGMGGWFHIRPMCNLHHPCIGRNFAVVGNTMIQGDTRCGFSFHHRIHIKTLCCWNMPWIAACEYKPI